MFDIACWSAPFHWQNLGSFTSPDEAAPSAGEILVVRLMPECDRAAGAVSRIPDLVAGVRRRHPGNPVVLWLPGTSSQVTIDAVRAASKAHVRGILGGEQPEPVLLRSQLTDPGELSSFVLRWASDAGYLPGEREHEDVRALLDAPPKVRTLNRLSREHAVAARTWRSHLQRLGLPSPRAWLALSHALHVALYIQRHVTHSIEMVARQTGMHTVANMNQQFRRVFGMPPGSVRGMLGGEPLLHRWFGQRVSLR